MNFYIFKSPHKKGVKPLEVLTYEPPDYIVRLRALKYGSIEIMNDDKLKEWEEQHED